MRSSAASFLPGARHATDLKSMLLAMQLIGLFIALLFTAGGGLAPERMAGSFIYFKAFLFALPLMTAGLLFLVQPGRILSRFSVILSENKWLFFYVVFCSFSLPLAVDWVFSLNRLLYMVYGLASVFGLILCYDILYPDPAYRYEVFANHLRVLTVLLLCLMIYILLRNGVSDLVPGFRMTLVRELSVHPNIMASYLAVLFLWHFSHGTTNGRSGGILYASMLLVPILLLFSRSVFGCLAAALAVASLFGFLWYRKQTLFVLVLFVVLLALVAALCVSLGVVSMKDLLEPVLRDQPIESFFGLTHRVDLWRLILSEVMLKNILVGNGYAVMTQDFSVDMIGGAVYGAHNAYLSIFLGNGILALTAFFVWMLSVLSKTHAARHSRNPAIVLALLGGWVFMMLNGIFEEQAGVATSAVLAYILLLQNIGIGPSGRVR